MIRLVAWQFRMPPEDAHQFIFGFILGIKSHAHACRHERKTIRGRRVIYEGRGDEANRSWVEYLRYGLDVFDERGSLVEVLGRLADLSVANAA